MGRVRIPTTALAGLLLVAAAVFYVATHATITTSVTHFLADTEERRLGELSAALPRSELARTVVLTVDADDLATAHRAADELAAALADDPEVAWVRRGVDDATEQALFDLYLPVRFAMARPDPDDTAALATPEGLAAATTRLRRELSGPLAPLVKRIAPEDPWLLLLDRLRALEAGGADGPRLDGGRFVTADGKGAVVLAATRHSPFESASAGPFLERLDRAVAAVRARHGPDLRVEHSSIHRIAAWSERTIRADVRRISIVSTVGLLAVLGFFFRSVRLLVLAFLPLASGIAVGAAASTAAFDTIHGLTLAFGATLIGVAIDYPSHLFAHLRAGGGPVRTAEAARGVWPGIALGAATTVAGFAGLAAASFPAVREMGVFASAGVAAAAATTRFVVVPLLPDRTEPVPATAAVARFGRRLLDGIRRRRIVGTVLLAGALALAAGGLATVRFADDARVLQRLEPDLVDEDERASRTRVTGARTKASNTPRPVVAPIAASAGWSDRPSRPKESTVDRQAMAIPTSVGPASPPRPDSARNTP